MALREGWLKCQVSEGMLPEEYTVECNSSDGNTFSFFASQEHVDPAHELVKVNIMDRQSDSCLVYVPSAPLEGGVSRTVKVSSKDVVG
ncbi:MAG: hypothetical protein KJ550_01010 [Proteobacteria bacterium]|nr:hypothetical protein [Desulfobacteraceae bacterium]MBU3980068.1 hypothetical protein [Pseudomonadota bacterium]MBU4012029.1 hypothetical protein [Pseudomonadota bacterium]MBU4068031.1 hypothetical protein [Pseudomonadota bacterium]MBU4102168.1 hypothetical protein [Pseudomonadota bacterium]